MVTDAISMDATKVRAMTKATVFFIVAISVPLIRELHKVVPTVKPVLRVRFAILQSAVLRVMAVMAAGHLLNSVTPLVQSGKIFGRNICGMARIGRCMMPEAGDAMRMALARRGLLAFLAVNGTARFLFRCLRLTLVIIIFPEYTH